MPRYSSTVLIVLLVLLAFPVTAEVPLSWDWAGTLQTVNETRSGTYFGAVTMDDSASLELALRHGAWGGWIDYRLGGELSYNSRDIFPQDVVLDPRLASAELVLPLGASQQGQARIQLGRQIFRDLTGTQFSEVADGLALNFPFPRWSAGAATGYFGWQDAATNDLARSPAEVADAAGYFAPHRLFVVGQVEGAPPLSPSIDLGLGAFGGVLFDLREAEADRYDSWFAEISIDLTLPESLSTTLWVALGAELTQSTAWAGGYELQWFPAFLPGSYLTTDLSYSQGANGSTPAYRSWSVRNPGLGTWFKVDATGLVVPSLKLLYAPFAQSGPMGWQNIGLGLKATTFFAAGSDRTVLLGIDPAENGYYGTEIEASLEFPVMGDIDLNLAVGAFYDGNGSPDPFSTLSFALNF